MFIVQSESKSNETFWSPFSQTQIDKKNAIFTFQSLSPIGCCMPLFEIYHTYGVLKNDPSPYKIRRFFVKDPVYIKSTERYIILYNKWWFNHSMKKIFHWRTADLISEHILSILSKTMRPIKINREYHYLCILTVLPKTAVLRRY